MTRRVLTSLAFISTLFFPWPITALLVLAVAPLEPLVPLAIGLCVDALYFVPQTLVPWPTLLGLVATAGAYAVRSRLKPSIIGG